MTTNSGLVTVAMKVQLDRNSIKKTSTAPVLLLISMPHLFENP